MRKRRRRRRRSIRRGGLAARAEHIDRTLEMIKADIDVLDRVVGDPFPAHLTEYEIAWVDGCREGMAIAYDYMWDRVQDMAIRGVFKPHPIKMRYFPAAIQTIKDKSLINKGTGRKIV